MSEQNPVKVAVLGATGGIGQPLSLLLKLSPLVDHVALYDILNTSGVAADLSHITSKAKVTHHQGAEQLEEALKGCTVVSIPAGIAQKPGMTRDDLFKVNAGIVKALAEACAKYCPKAILTIIANPVNSAVPIVCEVFKKAGVFDPKRILGVTTLDVVRTTTFVAEMKKLDMTKVKVPVIGGHSRNTILPLLSQTEPETSFTQSEIESMTDKVRFAGEEVLNAKAGTGSATLSMAYAGARIVFSLLKALQGESDIVECAYVLSDVTDVKYFSTPLLLGKNGWEKNLGLGKLSEFEKKKLSELLPELQKQIKKGEDFMVSH